jgi:hypothetical protein
VIVEDPAIEKLLCIRKKDGQCEFVEAVVFAGCGILGLAANPAFLAHFLRAIDS